MNIQTTVLFGVENPPYFIFVAKRVEEYLFVLQVLNLAQPYSFEDMDKCSVFFIS
jgi:hypothetical protein